jgi:regulator of protease activity HflC (stomatin/prohibitin superfamily)
MLPLSFSIGILLYIFVRVLVRGFYTVKPDERAVVTSFGRAQRLGQAMVMDPSLNEEEQSRYQFPVVRAIRPGGPYFKWPWQEVYKVSVATRSLPLTWDPTKNQSTVEAVTKDNLTTGVAGQIRFRVAERNLYAYLFGVSQPLEHVSGWPTSSIRGGPPCWQARSQRMTCGGRGSPWRPICPRGSRSMICARICP